MSDRRPLSSLTSGDFDHPPASTSLSDNVTNRLDRFRRTLERQREESLQTATSSRHERWGNPPSLRRRRLLRPAGVHSPTYEGRSGSRSDDSPEEEDRPRNSKRRRLDTYSHPLHERAYKYGYYGQVEPGRLKMELYSCDGGVHEERGPIYYGPNNVLRHDQSVYSSKHSRCNIVIRHHDKSPFSLQKLVIMAPENGFTAPVKTGSVCVAMHPDDLILVAAENMIHDMKVEEAVKDAEHGGTAEDREERGAERLSLLESLRDPEVSSAIRDRHPGGRESTGSPYPFPPIPDPLPTANAAGNRGGRIWPTTISWPVLDPQTRSPRPTPSQFADSPQAKEQTVESGIRVSLTCDEDVEWPEESTTATVLADRHRREQRARAEDFDSDDDGRQAWDQRWGRYNRLRRGIRPRIDSARDPDTVPKVASGELTECRFTIEQGKSKVAMTFDPPVSGTCILLQLKSADWPHSTDRNVDVQTVIACGYAGPRFFPAIEMK